MNKQIMDSIIKTENDLAQLLEACADYRNAIETKNYKNAKQALSVFEDFTEKHWWKLSIDVPIHDEDSLSEMFGEETVYQTA